MQIIVRDDDTSFFTAPELLDKVYGPLWACSVPVCLSVIPAQRADVRVQHRPGNPFDPGIPPQYRGQDKEFLVTENHELCAFLNDKVRRGLVEIVLHGYCHAYMEFTSDNAESIGRKLAEGKRTLQAAFPAAPLRTFIAPYDRVSPTALRLILEAGLNLCTDSRNLAEIGEYAAIGIGPNRAVQLSDRPKLYTCDEYLFHHRESAQDCLAKARTRLASENTLIIGNHYWSFFWDWNGRGGELLERWHEFVSEMLAGPERRITTFAEGECERLPSPP